jgi:hypothetical protein
MAKITLIYGALTHSIMTISNLFLHSINLENLEQNREISIAISSLQVLKIYLEFSGLIANSIFSSQVI